MFEPTISEVTETRKITGAFLGLNHNARIADGELYWMKNLTSDYYPLLAPRKKRGLQLSLGDNEWETVGLTITKEFYGDISAKYALWKTGEISSEEYREYKLSVSSVLSTFSSLTAEITYTCTGAINTEILTIDDDEWTGDFIAPEGTTKVSIVIRGIAADPDTFDEEDLDTYITDIDLIYRNTVIRGMVCAEDSIVYMIGSALYYGDLRYDMEEYLPEDDDRMSNQNLIIYGAYVLVFPANIYLNLYDPTQRGSLGNKNVQTGTATYSICDKDGEAISATESETAPDSPADGDYWLKNTAEPGLYQWYEAIDMWVPVTTTYVSISLTGIGEGFEVGDAVFMNTKLEVINNGSIIQAKTNDSIVVIGIINTSSDTEEFDAEAPFTIERRIPKLSYVCVSNNRVWGCYYGVEDDEVINEIYACKLGDPKNWYSYPGLSTDAYALSLGDAGVFTGAYTYQGYPMFFKENIIYKIYGAYPAQYQLATYDCRGVQQGSERSIAKVGEYLFYKSNKDVCIFDGSYPRSISNKLGAEMYYNAAAGACLNKYYISMDDESGQHHLFVYDIDKGLWHREDNLHIGQFAYSNNGQLYGQNGLKIYGFGSAKDKLELEELESEREIEWEAITGEYGYESPDTKEPIRLNIRVRIPFESVIILYVSYDDGNWIKITDIRGKDKVTSLAYPFKANRKCDHYRLKLEGRGDARVYSITETEEAGSDNRRY